jgi:hypothetical protein
MPAHNVTPGASTLNAKSADLAAARHGASRVGASLFSVMQDAPGKWMPEETQGVNLVAPDATL